MWFLEDKKSSIVVVEEVRNMTVLNVAAPVFIPDAELKSDRNDNTSHDVLCAAALTTPISQEQSFQTESLGTVVQPQCGACKYSDCPLQDSHFSFNPILVGLFHVR